MFRISGFVQFFLQFCSEVPTWHAIRVTKTPLIENSHHLTPDAIGSDPNTLRIEVPTTS